MAMMRRPFLIVSSLESQITSSPMLDGDQWIEGGEGVRGRMDHFALLDFEGRSNQRIQKPELEHAVVALTMSDLVLLRDRLIKLVEKGIRMGVLDVSGYTGEEGKPRG